MVNLKHNNPGHHPVSIKMRLTKLQAINKPKTITTFMSILSMIKPKTPRRRTQIQQMLLILKIDTVTTKGTVRTISCHWNKSVVPAYLLYNHSLPKPKAHKIKRGNQFIIRARRWRNSHKWLPNYKRRSLQQTKDCSKRRNNWWGLAIKLKPISAPSHSSY
jgi:hypothetical protein